MLSSQFVVSFVTLSVATAFLSMWMRRDRGNDPTYGGLALARARLGDRVAS